LIELIVARNDEQCDGDNEQFIEFQYSAHAADVAEDEGQNDSNESPWDNQKGIEIP
jgi:hypothetical protein